MDPNANTTSPYATDDGLQHQVAQRTQQDLAQRLGGVHLQHAEAGATAGVFREEILRLRSQVLDGLERDVERETYIRHLEGVVADLRQQLGLPPEAEQADAEDEPFGPLRREHRHAASYVADHHRAVAPEDHPLAEGSAEEDEAHAHGATNARLHAAFEAERARVGRELTAEEITNVHAAVAAEPAPDAPGDGPLPLDEVNGRLA